MNASHNLVDSPNRTADNRRGPSFLTTAMRNFATVGALAPSSRRLAEVLSVVVPRDGAPTVVELGAGTGAVTTSIARRIPAAGTQIAVEINPDLAKHLSTVYPKLTVLCGDAANMTGLLGDNRADAVVSGLPWSLFRTNQQRRILTEICRTLEPTGGFSTMAYWTAAPFPAARRFRTLLHAHFDEIVVSRTVWRNLPPAWAYLCRRPRPMNRDDHDA